MDRVEAAQARAVQLRRRVEKRIIVAAFALGIEVGKSDREILDYYVDSGNRAKEVVAFFLIAAAALAFLVFAGSLRSLIARAEREIATLAALAWADGTACAVLVLAGNAVSTAFIAMSEEFELDPNTRRVVEQVGFLLFASGALAAILLRLLRRSATVCSPAGWPGQAFQRQLC